MSCLKHTTNVYYSFRVLDTIYALKLITLFVIELKKNLA
jgi:hypothetical protein